MSRTIRVLIGFCLLLSLLLPVSTASAAKTKPPRPTSTPTSTPTPTQTPTPTPTLTQTPSPAPVLNPPWTAPSAVELAGHGCSLGNDVNGSETLFCKPVSPSGSFFTATLVIFAHGYVNPYYPAKKLPWDQLIFGAGSGQIVAYDMVTSQGFYFATTSYRANGLVVQDAIQDLLLVRDQALKKIGFRLLGVNVIVVGASEGGLVTTLSMERYASKYAGGLSMCGPIGDFKKQIDYWGDFRAIFDVYYPDAFSTYGGNAVDIPNPLITDWHNSATLKPGLMANAIATSMAPTNRSRTVDLLKAANAPYRADFSWNKDSVTDSELVNIQATLAGLLDYNIYATNNGKTVLSGNPYGNTATVYPGSFYFPNLNTAVKRYTASSTALSNINNYQTTGVITKPFVVLQNTGDPIVPAWHATDYDNKVPAANTKFSVQTSNSYGHCNFTESEIMTAFNKLGGYLTTANIAAAKTQLSPEMQEEFFQQLRTEGRLID